MKPLRKSQPRTPLTARARALLESVEPLPDSPERALRIRRALEARTSRPARRWPAAALVALVLASGASAFAAVRVFEALRAPGADDAAPAMTRPAAPHATRTKAPRGRPSAQPAPAPPPQPAPATSVRAAAEAAVGAEPAAPVGSPSAASPPRPRAPRALAPAIPARPAPPAEAAGESAEPEAGPSARAARASEIVHRALTLLRRDGDAAQAARLLDGLAGHAAGPLAEEALALRIEAAVQLEDARAPALARRYLSRYPAGRYADLARRALQMRGGG